MTLQEIRNQIENYSMPEYLSKIVTYGIKIPIFKLADYINEKTYYHTSQKIFADPIDLEKQEKKLYGDILERIDPDGLYMYALEGDGSPDTGDRCLHQGIMIAIECFRLQTLKKVDVDHIILSKLLKGLDKLVSPEGYLIRGLANYKFTSPGWEPLDQTKYSGDPGSGDQLIGLCFGLSVLLNTKTLDRMNLKARNLVTNMVTRLTNRLIEDEWKLKSFIDPDKTATHGYFNPNLFISSGASLAPIALLSVARYLTPTKKNLKKEFLRLWDGHCYKKLIKYSEIHLMTWNNWFGANVCAMGLFTIKQCLFKNKEVVEGLKRISHNTRDYGHLLFDLFSSWPVTAQSNVKSNSKLKSYFVKDGFFLETRKPWWSRKILRSSALSKRSLQDRDFIIQRNPFRDPYEGTWGKNYGRHDFLLEYYMYVLSEK